MIMFNAISIQKYQELSLEKIEKEVLSLNESFIREYKSKSIAEILANNNQLQLTQITDWKINKLEVSKAFVFEVGSREVYSYKLPYKNSSISFLLHPEWHPRTNYIIECEILPDFIKVIINPSILFKGDKTELRTKAKKLMEMHIAHIEIMFEKLDAYSYKFNRSLMENINKIIDKRENEITTK